MVNFTHLHVHTQYSILDGASDIPALFAKAKSDNMKALAITDHGNLYGVKFFYDTAKKNKIKPIIGCETYVAANSRFDRTEKEDRSGYHLILLAKNHTGYKNLIKLISLSWIEGFYYKPRIDKELLFEYHEGLIAMTACIAGEIPSMILQNDMDKARSLITEYKDVFKDDLYFEIQRHKTGIPEFDEEVYSRQEKVIEAYKELSKEYNIKIVATNDVHFINAEDADSHDILICLNTGKDIDDPKRMKYTKQEFLKTQSEMNELFNDMPEAIENTNEVAGKIENYDLDREPLMPEYPLPEGFSDNDEYLRHITFEGAGYRYGEITDEIKERIEFELSVIKKMGYPGYFLIVQDILNAAREKGVSVGPGRGSAAGSVVAYCIRITDIDPLKYNLLFERFLNPDRISMPDIDIDFDEDGRDEVLKWVVDKYGHQRVAHIITFGTMAAKMAIRDVARVLKLPLSDADRLAKLVPEGPKVTLKKAYKEVVELQDAKRSDNNLVTGTLSHAEILEGSVRHTGLHACGIIIGRDDLVKHIPICKSKDSEFLVTQFDGKNVESVGMLKMDLLGLKTLSIIKDAVENIKQSKEVDIDLDNISLSDEKTFELYSNGETTGLFQFESPGMKKHLKNLKPNRFEDLIAMNALYRPGPMEYIPSYINRKHGKEKIHYEHPVMEEHLKDTYGITVYQEQVMQLSQALAGFSRGQADSLRKAMGKKQKKVMDDMKEKFIEGCKANNIDEQKTEKIWKDWEAFAQYAFNKSHSTCYAYISYQTAYLKAHYPAEYMAAVLSRNLNDIKKITIFMDECKRMGLAVLGPDINESVYKFNVNKEGNIRFGLGAIKGVGEGAVVTIVKEREKNGNYIDIFDFVRRVDLYSVNKKSIEALSIAGAFDSFGLHRSQYFELNEKETSFIEMIIRYGNMMQNEKNNQQQSLFGETGDIEIVTPRIPECSEWGKLELLNKEKDLIGIFLSAHPLDDYKFEINNFCTHKLSELNNMERLIGKDITVAGIVTETTAGTTKNGNPFGTYTIEDYSDSFKLTLFSNDYINFGRYFTQGLSLLLKGKIQPKFKKGDELEFKISSADILSNVKEKMIKCISVKIPVSELSDDFIEEIYTVSESCKGKTILKFLVYEPDNKVWLELFSRSHKIMLTRKFLDFLEKNPEIEFKIN